MPYRFNNAFQLYCIREQLADNASNSLQHLQQAGFNEAEGFDLILLEQLKPQLDDCGIRVKSSFLFWLHVTQNHSLATEIGYPWLPEKWGIEYEIERAHKLGLDTLVMGYLLPQERQTFDDLQRNVANIQRAGEMCQSAGIQLLYHNHAFEFEPLQGHIPYFYMLEQIDTDVLGIELDVFWAEVAGHNAVELMQQFDGRVRQLHLKSGVAKSIPEYNDQLVSPAMQSYPLGTGRVDIATIVKQAEFHKVARCFIEQEYSQDNIVNDLCQSLHYLHTL